MSLSRWSRRSILVAAALVSASAAQAAERIVIGQTFIASGLDPAEGSAGWALVSHGVGEKLFSVGRDGRIFGQLAENARQLDDGGWLVTLRRGRSFANGAPVDAKAVVDALERTSAQNAGARATAGRLSFSVVDPSTIRIVSERPTNVMPSVLAEWQFVVYQLDAGKPVFTGPWAVSEFRPGEKLELVANTHFGADRPPLTIRRFADAQSMTLAMRAGELDMAFNLPADSLGMLRAAPNLILKSFPVAYQYMAWLNTRRGPLADRSVRLAIAKTIDRKAIATALGAGEPTASAFSKEYPFASDAPAPDADVAAANALLDQAGWARGSDGVRARNGERLKLTLWAYPQRADLVTMQPVLRAQLRAIGVEIETRIAENANDLARRAEFDILLWAQHTAPAADPAFFFNLFLKTGAANNFAGWSSSDLDRVIDDLNRTANPARRIALAKQAQSIAAEEAAAIFLITPSWHVALSQRLKDYQPWGSDYSIIRPDLIPSR